MAGTSLIYCVLIQVLQVTVYGSIEVYCPNQTGIEGKLLHLTCNVTCENCNSKENNWANDKSSLNCTDLKTEKIDDNHHVFNCSIQNASMDHSGKVKFWVQMNRGENTTTFNVTIEPHTANAAQKAAVTSYTPEPNGHSNIAFITVLIVLAVGIMMVVIYQKRKRKFAFQNHALVKNITGNDCI